MEANETKKDVIKWLDTYSNCCGLTTSGLPPDQPPVSSYLILNRAHDEFFVGGGNAPHG